MAKYDKMCYNRMKASFRKRSFDLRKGDREICLQSEAM